MECFLIQLGIGAICISFAPIFVKLIDLSPTLIGFYRCFFAAVLLLPWIIFRGLKKKEDSSFLYSSNQKKLFLFLSGASLFFAMDLFVWHRSVVYAGAGVGTILANTQVFYLSLFGFIFLKERPKPRFWLGVVLGFFGLFFLIQFYQKDWVGERFHEGVMFGLITGIAYASFILTLRFAERGREAVETTQKLFHLSLMTSLVLIPIVLTEGPWQWPEAS